MEHEFDTPDMDHGQPHPRMHRRQMMTEIQLTIIRWIATAVALASIAAAIGALAGR